MRQHQQGFVLRIALVMVALLAVLGGQLIGTARTAAALRAAADAELAADGAVHDVAFRLLQGTWPVGGLDRPVAPRSLLVGRLRVAVVVTDESVKINPNFATPGLLRSLLRQAGRTRIRPGPCGPHCRDRAHARSQVHAGRCGPVQGSLAFG